MKKLNVPTSVEEFQLKLIQITDALPKRLRQCADYVATHTDTIALATVADLAQAAGVQPSALMRFCQLMGFSGYSQMQRLFREDFQPRWPDYATRLETLRSSGDETATALLAEFVEAGRLSLVNLANSIDSVALEQAVSILAEAPMIHIIGFGRAFPVSAFLSYTFEKMDIPAMLHDKVGNIDHRHAVRAGDVLIVITFAPFTEETLELATFASEKGNQIVTITDALSSPLRHLESVALTVNEVDVGAFRALTAPLALAMTLAVAIGTYQSPPS